jgi:hypothetical protein
MGSLRKRMLEEEHQNALKCKPLLDRIDKLETRINTIEDSESRRIVEIVQDRNEFVTDVDGFVYYWPSRIHSGHLSAHHLRAIADELDKRNKDWEESINKYFEQQENL